MNETLDAVAVRAGVAHLHAPTHHPVVRGVLAHRPKTAEVRLLRLALLVPFGQPLRQLDGASDLDVDDVRVRVVCECVSASCYSGTDQDGVPSISYA